MPPRGVKSAKRKRQYEHIKQSYKKRGQSGRAEEIAARTVNKKDGKRVRRKIRRRAAPSTGARRGAVRGRKAVRARVNIPAPSTEPAWKQMGRSL